jgi:hypothetical protein
MDEVGSVDELGPVDWIVVEFPGSKFNGEIAPALRDLVDRQVVRVLDLLVLKKDSDGTLEAFELSDLDTSEIGELRGYESQLAMLLSEDDVTAVAAAIEPGSSAAVLVWENTGRHRSPQPCVIRADSWWPVAGYRSRRCWPRSKLMKTTMKTTLKTQNRQRHDVVVSLSTQQP